MSDAYSVRPRMRVITDNDYSGDPDGLVQLAHLLLSPSVDVRAVIGSHLRAGDPFDSSGLTADAAAAAARRIVDLCGRGDEIVVLAGANGPMPDHSTPASGSAAEAIVAEALRHDSSLPLYVICGGGLTDIASAWLLEPEIAERLTLIWIGGPEHDGMAAPPPGAPVLEYNTAIDPVAAQVVFNESTFAVWQVPRDVYRSAIAGWAEMSLHMAGAGPLGKLLFEALGSVASRAEAHGVPTGETYILGDSPLVLLTALQSAFEPAPASSRHVTVRCPRLLDSGLYEPRPDGRPLRVYTSLDTPLLFRDLWAKLALHARFPEGETT